jgi:hypothetical protein
MRDRKKFEHRLYGECACEPPFYTMEEPRRCDKPSNCILASRHAAGTSLTEAERTAVLAFLHAL